MKKTVLIKNTVPLVAAAAAASLCYLRLDDLKANEFHQIVSSVNGISVTLLGFTLTLVAIMKSLAHHRLIKNLARTRHLQRMYNRYFLAVAGYFVSLAVGLVLLLGNLGNSAVAIGGLLLPFIYSLLLTVTGTWVFYNIVSVTSAPTNES